MIPHTVMSYLNEDYFEQTNQYFISISITSINYFFSSKSEYVLLAANILANLFKLEIMITIIRFTVAEKDQEFHFFFFNITRCMSYIGKILVWREGV